MHCFILQHGRWSRKLHLFLPAPASDPVGCLSLVTANVRVQRELRLRRKNEAVIHQRRTTSTSDGRRGLATELFVYPTFRLTDRKTMDSDEEGIATKLAFGMGAPQGY